MSSAISMPIPRPQRLPKSFAVREALESLVVMLAPFSPHAAEEMWEHWAITAGLLKSGRWPQADPELAKRRAGDSDSGERKTAFARDGFARGNGRRTAHGGAQRREDPSLHRGPRGRQSIVVPQRLVNVVISAARCGSSRWRRFANHSGYRSRDSERSCAQTLDRLLQSLAAKHFVGCLLTLQPLESLCDCYLCRIGLRNPSCRRPLCTGLINERMSSL